MTALTVREHLLQAAHNEAHPGIECWYCPVQVAHRRQRQQALYDHLSRNALYGNIVVVSIVFALSVLVWLFA